LIDDCCFDIEPFAQPFLYVVYLEVEVVFTSLVIERNDLVSLGVVEVDIFRYLTNIKTWNTTNTLYYSSLYNGKRITFANPYFVITQSCVNQSDATDAMSVMMASLYRKTISILSPQQ